MDTIIMDHIHFIDLDISQFYKVTINKQGELSRFA